MIQNYINWEKKQIDWWKEKLGISESWSCLDIIHQGYFSRIVSLSLFYSLIFKPLNDVSVISVDNSKKKALVRKPGHEPTIWEEAWHLAAKVQDLKLSTPSLTARCHVCLSSHFAAITSCKLRIVIRAIFL